VVNEKYDQNYKDWLSYEAQVALLKERGMTVGDETKALDYLQRVGYYRLSAYWYPFRKYELVQTPQKTIIYQKLEDFEDNTHFLDAVELYLFDKKLKLLLVDALERIEVSVRVEVAHLLGKQDAHAHLKPELLHPSFTKKKNAYSDWLKKYEKQLHDSKEDFVKHHHQNYGSKLPIWAACEIWDFGTLSKLFAMMAVKDQQAIAHKYGLPPKEWETFQSWLKTLNYVRNICAHHSRLWNRNLDVQPKMPSGLYDWSDAFSGKQDLIARAFVAMAIIRHLAKKICPNTNWHYRVSEHLENFPELQSTKQLGLSDMGCPEDWTTWWNE
jgi:abortive infection bacteriophage resistance protein